MTALNDRMFSSLCTELASISDLEKPPSSPQSRFNDMYQQSRIIESQDDRRRRILNEYRTNKRDDGLLKRYAATFAGDSDIPEPTLDENLIEDGHEDGVDEKARHSSSGRDSTLQSPHRRNKIKFPRLMLSEWLLEVPSDFEDSWIMLPCPVGKRCSIVTCRGETFVYSRTGLHLLTGVSDLPGGSSTKRQSTSFTVLDCVFDKARKTFHLLDVLFWNGSSLAENTVEFRLFWLQSRLDEMDSHSVIIENDQFLLKLLPQFSCAADELKDAFASTTTVGLIDGYLFYHKESLYVSATTPLVCWLKPYMIPEILRVPVPAAFMQGTPYGYTTLTAHVRSLEEKRPKKPQRRIRNPSEDMEENSDVI